MDLSEVMTQSTVINLLTLLFLWLLELISFTQAACIQDDNCERNEICSDIKECYGEFVESDHDNITTTKSYQDTPTNTT